MEPITSGTLPAVGLVDEHQATGPLPATSAKPDDSVPPDTTLLAQRSVSSINLPQQEFDAQSVKFPATNSLKMKISGFFICCDWQMTLKEANNIRQAKAHH